MMESPKGGFRMEEWNTTHQVAKKTLEKKQKKQF